MQSIRARPFDYAFDRARLALVVIDMQRDFIEPGGFGASLGNDTAPLAAIVPTVARVLAAFRTRSLPVFHTRECHQPDLSDLPPAKRERGAATRRIGDDGALGRLLVAGEPGAEIVRDCAPEAGEAVFDKPGKDAFYRTGLEAALQARDIRFLAFAGVTTEVCVQTTMRAANDRGFDGLLLEDASASYFPEFHAATLRMVASQNAIIGWTATSDALLVALR